MKKYGIRILQLGIPVALFAYLLWNVPPDDYRAFWDQPKRWHLLVAAQGLALVAIVISFMRWRLLASAFGVPFTPREAMRLGFMGYLLNFVSFGSVGGDLFKAILAARDNPMKRPEAVASVLLDRAVGLMGLVILAWFALRVFGRELPATMIAIRGAAGMLAAGSIIGVTLALLAGDWFDRLLQRVAAIAWVGPPLARMASAARMLRARPATLLVLIAMALGVHLLLSLTIYLISCGVYVERPSLAQHLMVVPPGMAAGALPLAPGGIGLQEGALAGLFALLPDAPPQFSGMLVATVYRLITLGIAGIGLLYYLASHGREFRFVEQQAARR